MDAGLQPLASYARFFVTLTAVLDPFLAIPFFLALTADADAVRRRTLARAVVWTVFGVLAVSALLGERLLGWIGASLPAFRVGGGLVLLLMALAMLNAEAGGVRQTRAEAQELSSGEVSGVVPLAVPLLAGPGAISTTILAAEPGGAAHRAAIVGCIAAACAITWLALAAAEPLGRRLGTTGLNVATRLLGLLLAAFAIETMAEGLRGLFPALG